MIRLEKVSSRQRTLLWNLHQKYLHEMTNYYDDELDGEGNYHYGYFDAYFIQPERKAYFIYSDDRLAGFARILVSYAEKGDPAALGIVSRNMTRLARLAARLMDKSSSVNLVGLYGGVFQHSALARGLFERALKTEKPDAEIRLPVYPPELGALIHLMKKNGTLTPDTLLTLKNSYKEMQL